MQNDDAQSNQEILKKLRRKAELCRFSHAELKERYTKYRNWKEFSVVLLSVISAALIGFYYRGILTGNFIMSIIFLLPFATTLVQALDSTVFKWTQKVVLHESAVAIWGDWIREADFLEKRIYQYPSGLLDEKMHNIQEKYKSCMGNTEQIPNSKFLKYKKKFRVYVLESKEIGEMSLEDLKKTKWRDTVSYIRR